MGETGRFDAAFVKQVLQRPECKLRIVRWDRRSWSNPSVPLETSGLIKLNFRRGR